MSEGDKSASPRSDLGVRAMSGVAMIGGTLLVLWFGGWFLKLAILAAAGALLFEFRWLVRGFVSSRTHYIAWVAGGMIYIAIAAAALMLLFDFHNKPAFFALLASVWAVDIGAYAAGRTFGGPKIAPSISPSKTWAGLFGGMAAVTLWLFLAQSWVPADGGLAWLNPAIAPLVAVLAQAGDFFESWMKRRAGVKDSGTLIPGHGGVFDRLDGLLPVAIFYAALYFAGVQGL